ncbi:hypothetical protein DFH08DRAFT_899726 [Mycena albidolilacea]|uniref:Secreted protein n=1 Tax=Mycena albidolilacea TaxID=1033008 RepID=A0AAD6Z6A9_9AGAR|nr:hypothetical protein DFH08DRAFT_899726 [Mycena albidolilacea]
MVVAATRALLACALHACALLHPADAYYSLSGRKPHAAAGRRRLQTRGTRTSGHMSRRLRALDNPVARKEGEVGAGAGHPARARSGRLIYGREHRNIDYPAERKSAGGRKRDKLEARAVPRPTSTSLCPIAPRSDSARASTRLVKTGRARR